jgi:hypothetical protein
MTLPAQVSPRVAALLKKTKAARGRLIFAFDCTASREATWDLAAGLQTLMFEEAARIGGLDVQLVFCRGDGMQTSPWLGDVRDLARRMRAVRCEAGTTRIAELLRHIRAEQAHEKVDAAIFVGDAIEEFPAELYMAATGLGCSVFWFQEGDGLAMPPGIVGQPVAGWAMQSVEQVFRELARLTGGAYGKFDAGAAKHLGELLRAVAAFAVGGLAALANQNTDSARKLIGQLK